MLKHFGEKALKKSLDELQQEHPRQSLDFTKPIPQDDFVRYKARQSLLDMVNPIIMPVNDGDNDK